MVSYYHGRPFYVTDTDAVYLDAMIMNLSKPGHLSWAMAKEAWYKYVRTECCHIFSEDTLQSAGEGEIEAGGASFISRIQH